MVHVHDNEESNAGWLVTQVFNGNTGITEIWFFAADGLDSEPVCKLALPSAIPFGFSGVWQSN